MYILLQGPTSSSHNYMRTTFLFQGPDIGPVVNVGWVQCMTSSMPVQSERIESGPLGGQNTFKRHCMTIKTSSECPDLLNASDKGAFIIYG